MFSLTRMIKFRMVLLHALISCLTRMDQGNFVWIRRMFLAQLLGPFNLQDLALL